MKSILRSQLTRLPAPARPPAVRCLASAAKMEKDPELGALITSSGLSLTGGLGHFGGKIIDGLFNAFAELHADIAQQLD